MELETKFNSPEYEVEQTYDTLTLERTETTSSIQNVGKPSAHLKKRIFVIVAVIAIFIAVAASVSAFGVSFASKESTAQSAFSSGAKLCPLDTLDINLVIAVDSTPIAGDTLTVSCNNSTKLAGPSKIICLSTGSWSDKPICEKLKCPKIIITGHVLADDIQGSELGSVVTFSCQEGFLLKGNKSVVCLVDGNWSPLPVCEPLDCSIPPNISNGKIRTLIGTSFNTILQVECNKGYRLVDINSNLLCNKFGFWEGSPECQSISCSLPSSPENGYIRSIDGLEYQSKAYFGCFEGFSLIGNDTISCLENGTWNAEPRCVTIGCGFPKPIKYGIFHVTTTEINSTIAVTCTEGFSLSGQTLIICTRDGLWTESPTCIPKPCGELMLPSNTYLLESNGTTFSSTARVKCGNFKANDSVLVTCTSTGEWSDLPYCGCEVPRIIKNGQIKLTSTDINSTLPVTCHEGYQLSGPSEILCDANGTWTQYPTCELVSCGDFVPNNYSVVTEITGTTLNSTIRVQCKGSNDTDQVICTSNGQWSEQPPCVMSDCLKFRKAGRINSGVYTVRLWNSTKMVNVYCDMDTDGGGWTVFQNRFNGSVAFNRSFLEYESGFGSIDGEFWLSLLYVQELTDRANGASELRLDLAAANGDTAYEVYQNFYLSGGNSYILNIGSGVGTAGDSTGLSYNRGRGFSTYDRDVDGTSGMNCAIYHHGGWWYDYCTFVNLNGQYATPGQNIGQLGMFYHNFKQSQSLETSKMMFRRTS